MSELNRLREYLSVIRISAWERHTTLTEDNRTLLTRLSEETLQLPADQRLTTSPAKPKVGHE